jgi:hypothetical protein
MENQRSANDVVKHLAIHEKVLASLADSFKRHETESREEIRDLQAEVKALKMFLARAIPDFKKQFPELQRKIK